MRSLLARVRTWCGLPLPELLARIRYRLQRLNHPDPACVDYQEWIRRNEPILPSEPPPGLYQWVAPGAAPSFGVPVWKPGAPLPSGLAYLLVLRGGCINPTAWQVLTSIVANARHALVYGDHDQIDACGRRTRPTFLPGWDPELLLEVDYLGPAVLLRRDLVERMIAADDGQGHDGDDADRDVSGYAWLLRSVRLMRERDVARYPLILSHRFGEARNTDGRNSALHAWLEARAADECPQATNQPAQGRTPCARSERDLTIVIPTRDHADLLRECLDSIAETVAEPVRLVIVDNGTRAADALALIEAQLQQGAHVVRIDEPFNYSRLANAGVRASSTDTVCLLNNDIVAHQRGWLGLLSAIANRREVGVAGPMLRYPSGGIQHAGIVLDRAAGPRHIVDDNAPWIDHPHQQAAITGACMVFTRANFEQVNGFDEALAVAFNDVDFCLKLRVAGRRVVWTPAVVLTHRESASRGRDISPQASLRAARELQLLRERWRGALQDDPFYNPNFASGGRLYALSPCRSDAFDEVGPGRVAS